MKKKIIVRAFCIAASLVASACSAHSSSTVLPATASPSNAGTGAKLSIVVPRASSSRSMQRRPQYVSPSSAQLNVAVNGGTASTYGLSPSTPGCSVVLQNLSCVFTIAAPAGNDSFALTLADGTGNVLSHNVVTAILKAGTSTPVNVTLSGVPASVAIVPGTGATIEGSASPAYHVPGLFAQPIEVEALDADGNVIVGPGAPVVSAPTVSGSTNATVISANGNDPNAYVLKATGPAGGQTITVSASARGVALNDGTTSAAVNGSQVFTYTPAVATVSGRLITTFSVETGNTIAQMNVCSGLCVTTFGTAVVADSHGDLYVAVTSIVGLSQTRVVNVYSTGSQSPTSQLATHNGVTGATSLAVDKNDMLYVVNAPTGFGLGHHPASITEYAFGATTPTHSISGGATGISSPSGVAVDGSGNVYEADGSGFVNVYGSGNQTAPQQTLSDPQLATPSGIAIDSSGALYVSDSTNGYIAYFPAGSTSVTTTISDPTFGGNPGQLMFDPQGNLWVSIGSTSVEELTGTSLPNVSLAKVLSMGGALAWIP